MLPIYAQRIREIRQKEGLTQPEFASRIGTTKNQISKYELDKEPIPVKHIINICVEFDISADWLLGIEEYKLISAAISVARKDTLIVSNENIKETETEYNEFRPILDGENLPSQTRKAKIDYLKHSISKK